MALTVTDEGVGVIATARVGVFDGAAVAVTMPGTAVQVSMGKASVAAAAVARSGCLSPYNAGREEKQYHCQGQTHNSMGKTK